MCGIGIKGVQMKILRTLLLSFALLPAIALAHPAEDLVRQITTDVLDALKSPNAGSDASYVRGKVDTDVLPHIDFTTMTKLTLGSKQWKKASKEQRTELVDEFRQLLLNTYTAALDQYSGQTLEILPHTPSDNDDKIAVIRTVFDDSGSRFSVHYKLRSLKADRNIWKVYDIEVDRVSLAKSYKAEFNSQIQDAGVDGLIKTLRDKNSK